MSNASPAPAFVLLSVIDVQKREQMLNPNATARSDSAGLTPKEASTRLARVGPNRLFTPAPVRFWAIAAEEITEPMILLLLVVGVLYSLWSALGDAITIFAVIVLLVAAEVGNEFRAKRAIAALERITAPRARVRRAGRIITVDIETVVPGDVLIVVPGTRISADGQAHRCGQPQCG